MLCVCVCFSFFPVHHQSLRLSQTHNFADRQCARRHRVTSEMLLVACNWRFCYRFCQWCSDWCAPGCSATMAFGGVCLSHVSGSLRLVEVFTEVPLGMSCLSRVGSGDTLWPVKTLGRRQVVSSWHSATSGRRVMRARIVFWRSGASGMGAKCS